MGKSLTFSFLKIIRRLLLFARLSYYFTPVLGSQSLPPSSRPPFWPAGFILPPFIENLLIYFFQYGSFGGGVNNGCSWLCSPKFREMGLEALTQLLSMMSMTKSLYHSGQSNVFNASWCQLHIWLFDANLWEQGKSYLKFVFLEEKWKGNLWAISSHLGT